MQLIYIGLGGAAGSMARYRLSGWVYALFGRVLPWGTFAVNLLGSLLLGLLMELGLRGDLLSPGLRLALTVGFMGGFTTFSTFSYETFRPLEEGSYLQAGLNILLNVLVCLISVAMGIALARQMN